VAAFNPGSHSGKSGMSCFHPVALSSREGRQWGKGSGHALR
jgi:hypothetical protein